jgi:hypothetical protein
MNGLKELHQFIINHRGSDLVSHFLFMSDTVSARDNSKTQQS